MLRILQESQESLVSKNEVHPGQVSRLITSGVVFHSKFQNITYRSHGLLQLFPYAARLSHFIAPWDLRNKDSFFLSQGWFVSLSWSFWLDSLIHLTKLFLVNKWMAACFRYNSGPACCCQARDFWWHQEQKRKATPHGRVQPGALLQGQPSIARPARPLPWPGPAGFPPGTTSIPPVSTLANYLLSIYLQIILLVLTHFISCLKIINK